MKGTNQSRLTACGWDSFRPALFFGDDGRKQRNVGDDFIQIINEVSTSRNILELCSGGGKLLIQLAKAGYKVTGIDLSKNMLDICRRNIENENKAVQERIMLIQDDICTLNLRKRFDFIILEDDGFMYLLTQEDQLSCLRGVHNHLAENGFFFLSFATPQRELNSQVEFAYDPIHQIKTQPCVWTLIDENGTRSTVNEGVERRRLTYPCELELLLTNSGLHPVSRWGDLQKHPFVDPLTQEYNYLIVKGHARGHH
jgi:SAM-dependent methyltransferase